ncbi:hypothetical protein [Bacillus sp. B-jedd]|uniref:hypothetical protein n=1 Tax=Bacillus sp. B-jedd TaxID=1476857 RepID=UPI0011DE27F5|nr:hypothetical protein [Bacillus sp. B-jedd]
MRGIFHYLELEVYEREWDREPFTKAEGRSPSGAVLLMPFLYSLAFVCLFVHDLIRVGEKRYKPT